MKILRAMLIAGASVGLAGAPASAASGDAVWSMDVDVATVVSLPGGVSLDLTGTYSRVPGAVGSAVRFGYDDGPSLATASSVDEYDPGTADFAVAAYLRPNSVPTWGDYSPNIVQKGFSTSPGQWKMQLEPMSSGTVAGCRFAGSGLPEGDLVVDSSRTPLDDGAWHAVVCWRDGGRYGVTVDGRSSSASGDVGRINSSRPLRVANKSRYAGVEDQFQGRIDCIAYVEGSSARSAAESRVPC